MLQVEWSEVLERIRDIESNTYALDLENRLGQVRGTGFFVHGNIFVTCYHVISPTRSGYGRYDTCSHYISQFGKGRQLDVFYVIPDQEHDLALLITSNAPEVNELPGFITDLRMRRRLESFGYADYERNLPHNQELLIELCNFDFYWNNSDEHSIDNYFVKGYVYSAMSGSPVIDFETGLIAGVLNGRRNDHAIVSKAVHLLELLKKAESLLNARGFGLEISPNLLTATSD